MKTPTPPSTRYQGSKLKLCSWIWQQIKPLRFHTVLDVFGGTGSVSYHLKTNGKAVTYNDFLRFNYLIATALIANNRTKLLGTEVDQLFRRHHKVRYANLIASTFEDIYFTSEENVWLDVVTQNIGLISNRYKKALAYFALFQSCIVKRPYNLFHRKNLYMRTAKVKRSFYNKNKWDAPFEEHFRSFVREANNAVFDSGIPCTVKCLDALEVPGEYELVYIDSPYINSEGRGTNYLDYYHFLEGIASYPRWHARIDNGKKHLPLKGSLSPWADKRQVRECFAALFERFRNSIIVLSYRSDGYLSQKEFKRMLSAYKKEIRIIQYGRYKYALSSNGNSKEYLIIAQ